MIQNTRMKTIYFFLMPVFITLFSQCKTGQPIMETNPTFQWSDIYAQNWAGGQPGNAGINVVISMSEVSEIVPDSLYFRNRISPIEIKNNKAGILWIGRFKTVDRKEPVLQDDPTGNTVVEVPEAHDFPFELENHEAIIRYTENGKVRYYKFSNIKEKEPLFFPAAKPSR